MRLACIDRVWHVKHHYQKKGVRSNKVEVEQNKVVQTKKVA
jgi:hypothetical protein